MIAALLELLRRTRGRPARGEEREDLGDGRVVVRYWAPGYYHAHIERAQASDAGETLPRSTDPRRP